MKKTLVVLMLGLVSITGFGQNYDVLGTDISVCDSITWNANDMLMLHFSNSSKDKIYNVNTTRHTDVKYIPNVVFNRYMYGNRLMKAGWVNFGVGLGIAAVGGLLLVTKDRGQTITQIKAGDALMGIGGTLVSISLPLLCFGDAAKREANVDYETFNLHFKK